MVPYYERDGITIYCGDCREIMPTLPPVDVVVADPPYEDTNLTWDRKVHDWFRMLPIGATQVWIFGSLRSFLSSTFTGWSFAQDVIWEKQNGSCFHVDRLRRVHELIVHLYRGEWSALNLRCPTTPDATARVVRSKARPQHWHGKKGPTTYVAMQGGPRLLRSVIHCRNEHGRALHPTQKPLGVVVPIVAYSVGIDRLVLDPFMGSGTTLVAAKSLGRRAIGIEIEERYCEVAAKRLAQQVMNME